MLLGNRRLYCKDEAGVCKGRMITVEKGLIEGHRGSNVNVASAASRERGSG